MKKYSVFLDDVPSVNHLYFNIPNRPGVRALTKDGREFKERAVLILRTAIPFRGLEGKVIVEADAHWPDKRRRDMNNYAKVLCDCIEEAGIVKDDKTILWREMDFVYDKGVQGFMLTIYEKELKKC